MPEAPFVGDFGLRVRHGLFIVPIPGALRFDAGQNIFDHLVDHVRRVVVPGEAAGQVVLRLRQGQNDVEPIGQVFLPGVVAIRRLFATP